MSKTIKRVLPMVLLASTAFAGDGMNETKAMIADLQNRLQELEKKVGAEKELVRSRDSKFKVTLSGQLNRAVLYAGNNTAKRIGQVDNDASSSRFNITGEANMNENFKARTVMEVELNENASNDFDPELNRATRTSGADNPFRIRQMDVQMVHAKYGELHMGKGHTASDHVAESDLSGTYVASGGSDVAVLAGNVLFARKGTTGSTDTRVSHVFQNLDGLGRANRVKYVTPNFHGVTAEMGAVSGKSWDGALKFSGAFGDTKVQAAVAYFKSSDNADDTSASDRRGYAGSFSVLLPMGLSISAAGGKENHRRPGLKNGHFYHAKLGYRKSFMDVGETRFAVDFGEYKNLADTEHSGAYATNKGRTYGAMAVQALDKLGTELYLTYRRYELKDVKTSAGAAFGTYHPINVVMGGARVKF